MKFTPSVLKGVPTEALIIFTAPKNAPFYLYETQFNPIEDACASYTRINGISTSGGATQIYKMTSSKPTAYFACGKAGTPCICDRDSLFFINPSSDRIPATVYPQTINPDLQRATTLPSSTAPQVHISGFSSLFKYVCFATFRFQYSHRAATC